jgi:tRNA modification GTPase
MKLDTIYALSSGAGKAGVAVVRLSGPDTARVVASMCGGLPHPRMAELRTLRSLSGGEVMDRCLALWFPAPGSFTGEDLAEFHVHGSLGVVRWLLEELGGPGGLRPADPGEFARRAFMNGKMDLVEIEGLADMLESESRQQVRQALFHVDGHASKVFGNWRCGLIGSLALAEACIDFSDEEGVELMARPQIPQAIKVLRAEMAGELEGAERGRRTRMGVRVVLAGAPNAGKSSLMNAIARRDVAIVSKFAGTTRDVVEVSLDLGGFAVDLADTAGLRDEVDSEVEQLGIGRTRQRLEEADLVLLIGSPDAPWPSIDIDSDTIRVWNKVDIGRAQPQARCDVEISALSGAGLPELLDLIELHVARLASGGEPALLTRDRQIHAVRQCLACLDRAIVNESSFEIVAEELRTAARLIDMLVGKVDVEDLLEEIFSRFCVGK